MRTLSLIFLLITLCICERSVGQNRTDDQEIEIIKGVSSAPDDSGKVTMGAVYEGDTIPLTYLPVVDVFGEFDPESAERLRRYLKLRRDVIRAYPYAKLAAMQLKYVNDSIPKIKNKRKQKKFIRETEKDLKEQFSNDLKKLTRSQGYILIKLIDRETGETSYELVKELRGSLKAFFWQSVARLFGSDMKAEYDPEGEDATIESIVQAIERGEISVIRK
jgi:hypothetical protein